MASKEDKESEAQAPDKSQVGTLDFEATADRLEQLMTSMEELVLEVEQLRGDCSNQARELMRAAADLRKQQEELKEGYAELSREMKEIMDSVDDMFRESDFETKETQAEKLNQQLLGEESD